MPNPSFLTSILNSYADTEGKSWWICLRTEIIESPVQMPKIQAEVSLHIQCSTQRNWKLWSMPLGQPYIAWCSHQAMEPHSIFSDQFSMVQVYVSCIDGISANWESPALLPVQPCYQGNESSRTSPVPLQAGTRLECFASVRFPYWCFQVIYS